MIIKFFFLFTALVAASSAQPGIAIVGTHAQSYNAHAINHAYGLVAAPAISAYSLYPSGYIGALNPYSAPLIVSRR